MADVQQLLDSLPDTPDGIAGFLEQQGIKGERDDGHACPIARYLESWSDQRVYVTAEEIRVVPSQPGVVLRQFPFVAYTPHPVSKFIRAFDSGSYPQLEEQ